jgi:hypothetical protein
MEGHAETLAADVTCANAGVLILGQGNGNALPTITTAGFHVILSGVGVQMSNVALTAGTSSTAAGIVQLSGASSVLDSCVIVASHVATVGVVISASTTTVQNCRIQSTSIGFASGIAIGAVGRVRIIGNEILGIFATAPINFTGGATNILIRDNSIQQLHATVGACIAGIVTAVSGLIANNRLTSVGAGAATDFFTGANVATNVLLFYLQNFGFAAKAGPSSGILVPGAGTIP